MRGRNGREGKGKCRDCTGFRSRWIRVPRKYFQDSAVPLFCKAATPRQGLPPRWSQLLAWHQAQSRSLGTGVFGFLVWLWWRTGFALLFTEAVTIGLVLVPAQLLRRSFLPDSQPWPWGHSDVLYATPSIRVTAYFLTLHLIRFAY